MVDQAPGPGVEAAGLPAYSRASIEEFIAQAEAERTRLHADLRQAHERRRAAEGALFDDRLRSDRLHLELGEAWTTLDGERRATWHTVSRILAEAEVEAETLLAAARAEADAIRAGERPTSVRPALDLVS